MKKIENFVKNSLKGYKGEDKETVITEITEMLTEKVEELIEEGLSEQEAIDQTVVEFGSLEEFLGEKKKVKVPKNRKQRINDFMFSIGGSSIIITMLVLFNVFILNDLLNPPYTYFIYVIIPAILFWPLSMIYSYFNTRLKDEHE